MRHKHRSQVPFATLNWQLTNMSKKAITGDGHRPVTQTLAWQVGKGYATHRYADDSALPHLKRSGSQKGLFISILEIDTSDTSRENSSLSRFSRKLQRPHLTWMEFDSVNKILIDLLTRLSCEYLNNHFIWIIWRTMFIKVTYFIDLQLFCW